MKAIDPRHEKKQKTLRRIGIALIAIGGLLTVIGLASFFMAFVGMGSPRFFWCAFVGMPIGFAGLVLTGYGFMGAVSRYAAGEMAPVGKDTFNYMAEGTQDGVRTLASAVGEGLGMRGPATGAAEMVRCLKCNHANSSEAKFCGQCGFSLQKTRPCPACKELNDPDAKFCDNCGRALAGE